jgi:hypothetical protein
MHEGGCCIGAAGLLVCWCGQLWRVSDLPTVATARWRTHCWLMSNVTQLEGAASGVDRSAAVDASDSGEALHAEPQVSVLPRLMAAKQQQS